MSPTRPLPRSTISKKTAAKTSLLPQNLPSLLRSSASTCAVGNRIANIREGRVIHKFNLVAVAPDAKLRPQLIQIHRHRRILPLRILLAQHMRSRGFIANGKRLRQRPLVIDRSTMIDNGSQRIL